MRIISAGNVTIPYGGEALLNRALERAGHEVIRVFYPTNKRDYQVYNDILEQTISNKNPDLIIVGKIIGLQYLDIVRLKNKYNVPIVQLTYDLMRKLTFDDRPKWWHPQIAQGGFDWVFGASDNQDDKKEISKHTACYSCLREGVDLEFHKPYIDRLDANERLKYTADVAFTGQLYNKFRQDMNLMLRSMMPNIIYKNHSNDVFLQELAKMASVTKMSIGTNYQDDIQGYWSARVFENMGVGLAFVTPNIEGMKKEGLKHGKNCINYQARDLDDLKETILLYKDCPSKLDKIKKNATELIFERHTFDHRVQEMMKKLNKEGIL